MKRTLCIFAVVALTVGLFAAEAGAGWFDKNKDKDADNRKKSHRYDLYPSLSFNSGVLNRDARTGWQLGEVNIQFVSGCRIGAEEGVTPELREGSTALVMGPRYGDTILAYQVQIQRPDYMDLGISETPNVRWSTEDPTVGEGIGVNPQ